MSDFLTGYFLGEESARNSQVMAQHAATIMQNVRRNLTSQPKTELEWAYARIAQLEGWADLAMAEIERLSGASEEAERLRDQVTRLSQQVSGLTAQVKHLETIEEIRRILRDDGNAG